jgi:hypothetical protein
MALRFESSSSIGFYVHLGFGCSAQQCPTVLKF